MRIILASLLALALGVAPAAAQDADRAARVDLAQQFLELTDSSSVRRVAEDQLKVAFGAEDIGAAERAWLIDAFGDVTQRAYAGMIRDVRDEVAALYTREELEALVAFSSSSVGRAINAKSARLGVVISEAFGRRVMQELPALEQKYCLRFDCSTEGEEPTSAK